MGKQNTPLILGFVNNAARNTFNVSQKQVQNKAGQQKAVKQQKPQQQQSWTVVGKKTNTKGFQSWAEVASRKPKNEIQSNWTNVVKPQKQAPQPQKQAQKQQPQKQIQKQQPQKQAQKQQPQKPVQKQVIKQQPQKQKPQQQKKNMKTQQTQTWGWYPASKQEAELKKLNAKKQSNKKGQNRPMKKQQSKQQKMRIAAMLNNKTLREAEEFRRAQEQKKNYSLLKNINTVYDGFSYTFPLQNNRSAWICTDKVGGNKVMSVATLYAIKYAPTVRGNKKPFVQRNGQIIFNNKCIRRAVEGQFTGHKKFRGNRVLTYIPEKWLCKDNSYSKGANYEKYANLNEIKRNERCFSFKGVY